VGLEAIVSLKHDEWRAYALAAIAGAQAKAGMVDEALATTQGMKGGWCDLTDQVGRS
jgi:hypothetical protein